MSVVKGTDIRYSVIVSDRKSYALKILPDGNLELRIPKRTPVKEIDNILSRHRDWIIESIRKQKERFLISFADGAFVPFMGEKLVIKTGEEGKVSFEDGAICLPNENREKCLSEFYRYAAKKYLPGRLAQWANQMGVEYKSVRINSAKGRWGSCSSKVSINFSFRTMMLPVNCIDYVLVHELCHIKHMDHSAAFWAEVEKVLPDYKERERQIKNAFVVLL